MQILVHSYIYYELDRNIIDDYTWSMWAKQLVELQEKYPEVAEKVIYANEFKSFDGSTGHNLYFDDKIINTANWLLKINER